MMDLCEVHTILRLPTGIFYAQGVNTNVIFLHRGQSNKGSTKAVWIYDMRTNMDAFGKTRPLTREDFQPFELAYGANVDGSAKRKDTGDTGRFRIFTRKDIAKRGENLALGWLKDTTNDPEDEMTEPEELADAIAVHLKKALEEIDAFAQEMSGQGEEVA